MNVSRNYLNKPHRIYMGANILKGGDIPKVLRGNIPGGTTPDLFLH
jgi:hypothetical protein